MWPVTRKLTSCLGRVKPYELARQIGALRVLRSLNLGDGESVSPRRAIATANRWSRLSFPGLWGRENRKETPRAEIYDRE